ncbi:MAG TPA: hypothetical protein PLM42_07060, partial [Methanothermobacter thermautotrophicus]|nr:hypothetical protein [Methanothermobacter thermautotrophicus]
RSSITETEVFPFPFEYTSGRHQDLFDVLKIFGSSNISSGNVSSKSSMVSGSSANLHGNVSGNKESYLI